VVRRDPEARTRWGAGQHQPQPDPSELSAQCTAPGAGAPPAPPRPLLPLGWLFPGRLNARCASVASSRVHARGWVGQRAQPGLEHTAAFLPQGRRSRVTLGTLGRLAQEGGGWGHRGPPLGGRLALGDVRRAAAVPAGRGGLAHAAGAPAADGAVRHGRPRRSLVGVEVPSSEDWSAAAIRLASGRYEGAPGFSNACATSSRRSSSRRSFGGRVPAAARRASSSRRLLLCEASQSSVTFRRPATPAGRVRTAGASLGLAVPSSA
jgi:hypothetical protein